MDTEKYCNNLENLDKNKAIRAIHEAYLQLNTIGERIYSERIGTDYDNRPAIQSLRECLKDAGHIGFTD